MIDEIKRIYGMNDSALDIKVKPNSGIGNCRYSDTEKVNAIKLYFKLGTYTAAEKETGISRNTIIRWVDESVRDNPLEMKKLTDVYGEIKGKKRYTAKCDLKVNERKKEIIKNVSNSIMTVQALASKIQVADNTIRTDLKELILDGVLKNISKTKRCLLVVLSD